MGKFTVATFNANSIRARLSAVLEWMKKQEPDVLSLQECKVQEKEFPFEAFESLGYKALYRGQKSYNGVAVLTKHPTEGIRTGLYEGMEEEARFISARIGQIPVVNAYVPQGVAPGTEKFAYKLRWLKDLLAHLGQHYSPKAPLVVTGDFNVALEPRDVYDPEGLRGEVGFHPDAVDPEGVPVLGARGCPPQASAGRRALHVLGLPDPQCPEKEDGLAH
jgi:exodeoxyribonuclease-3